MKSMKCVSNHQGYVRSYVYANWCLVYQYKNKSENERKI